MEFFISRAIHVGSLEIDQLERLHRIEKRLGYCLPWWNYQELTGAPDTKSVFMVPDDPEAQGIYRARIESDIRSNNLTKTEAGEFPLGSNVEVVHQYDYNIFHNKDKIRFYYSSREKTDRLVARLNKAESLRDQNK